MSDRHLEYAPARRGFAGSAILAPPPAPMDQHCRTASDNGRRVISVLKLTGGFRSDNLVAPSGRDYTKAMRPKSVRFPRHGSIFRCGA